MIPLKYPRLWILLGWGLVVAVIAASVSPAVMIAVMSFTWGDKLAHAASYCVLMVWFAGLYARRRHGLVALALISLGIALEFVQLKLPYREFDPADMIANAVGVFIGLALSVSLLTGWCQRMESRLSYHE